MPNRDDERASQFEDAEFRASLKILNELGDGTNNPEIEARIERYEASLKRSGANAVRRDSGPAPGRPTKHQLMAALQDTETSDNVCEVIARLCWAKAHEGETCPSNRIPNEATLARWWNELPHHVSFMALFKVIGLLEDLFGETAVIVPWPMGLSPRELRVFFDSPNGAGEPMSRGMDLYTAHRKLLEYSKQRSDLHHFLEPLVDAWQRLSAVPMEAIRVTATTPGAMVRRPRQLSAVVHTPWENVAVDAATVDGEPIATMVPSASPYPYRRTRYQASQSVLPSARNATAPRHMLLTVVGAVATGDGRKLALSGDLLMVAAIVHALDGRLELPDSAGAALMARTRNGGFRTPKPSDFMRWHNVTLSLRSCVWRCPATGKWFELVEVSALPNSTVIGRPDWAHGKRLRLQGGWTLTTEGGRAARSRIVASVNASPAGRIVSAIEYHLAAHWDGRPGIAPYLRPARGKAGPGEIESLDWRYIMRAAGFVWDSTDQRRDRNMLETYRRAVARLQSVGYQAPNAGRGAAPAGDAIEIVDVVRANRSRPAGLKVRASDRFVEAARQSVLGHGKGFSSVALTDWLGDIPHTGAANRP